MPVLAIAAMATIFTSQREKKFLFYSFLYTAFKVIGAKEYTKINNKERHQCPNIRYGFELNIAAKWYLHMNIGV